jgi:formylglycine-generating enzyme required for sulfatase activity
MGAPAVSTDELDALLAVLRRERLPVGVTETERLHRILALEPEVGEVELGYLVACVVARSTEERKACLRAVALWFQREGERLEGVIGALPRAERVEREAVAAVVRGADIEVEPRGEVIPADAEPAPAVPMATRSSPPPTRPGLLRDWIIGLGVGMGVTSATLVGAAGGGVRSFVASAAVGMVAVSVTAAVAVAFARRRWVAAPPAGRTVEHDLPPPPVEITVPVLLDGGTRESLVAGVGSYLSERRLRAIEPRHTTRATSRSAGMPSLVFRRAREVRTVWLWVDERSLDGLLLRAVREIHDTLAAGGVEVEAGIFRGIPSAGNVRRLRLTRAGLARGPHPRLTAEALDAQRRSGVVAVLTDGRALSLAVKGPHAAGAHQALRALASFDRLAMVDFGEGQTGLPGLVGEHGVAVIRPAQLAAFLSEGAVGVRETGAEPIAIEGAVRELAAACALSPRAVEESTALALRDRLGLGASAWSVGVLARACDAGGAVAFAPDERARLLLWVQGQGDGVLEGALGFWGEHFRESPVDAGLLGLWGAPGEEPDEVTAAVQQLWNWSESPLGARVRAELARHAPRPEGLRPVRDPGGKIVLPWRRSELSPETRVRLDKLGLGHLDEAGARPEERERMPGTVALALGLGGGVAAGALLALTGAAWAVGVVGVALVGVVYGVVRRVAREVPEGEEPEREYDAGAGEPTQPAEVRMEAEPAPVLEPSEPEPASDRPTPMPEVTATPLLHMLQIPGGSFLMGSRKDDPRAYGDEKPQHQETVEPLLMSQYVVTQAQYQAIMGNNPGTPRGENLPVNKVSWFDAVDFCNALSEREGLERAYERYGKDVAWSRKADGYRLPTEAEWEYAARAGTETAWSFGDDEAQLGEYAWYAANSGGELHPVGEKKPNPWGLHDVHGNVYDWCWDGYGPYPTSLPVASGRVSRGGSFMFDPWDLRSADRYMRPPESRSVHIGFRVVRGSFRQP